jgi:16S rRNA G527 N7-methylase RsmG
VILVDRNTRKIRFLDLVVAELGLHNVTTRCVDVSARLDLMTVDVLVSRAVASPARLWALGQHLLSESGVMILMTGTQVEEEAEEESEEAAEPEEPWHAAVHRIEIPGLDRAHKVTVIRHRKDEEDPVG